MPSKDSIPLETLEKTVVNLSNVSLTKEQLFVFYLGKSYAPTPPLPNIMRFKDDIEKWTRSMRIAYWDHKNCHIFNSNTTTNSQQPYHQDIKQMEKSIITTASSWNIPDSKCSALELFIKLVSKELLEYKCGRVKHNPSNIDKMTQKAITEMKNWDDKVIRLFDKGSGFFILNREDYIDRTMKDLNDETTFEIVTDKQQAVTDCVSAIKSWTEKYSEEPGMTKKLRDWIIPTDNNCPGNNYSNFKAHKPEKDYPGRLISTGCNSYTKNLATLTAYELKKVQLEHNLRDTNQFLQKIDEVNKSGLLKGKSITLVSFDIVAMFPSIPKDLGLDECRRHLDKREKKIFSTDCIIDGLEITLDHNLTSFNNNLVKQRKGAGMGTTNACEYSDTSMNSLDELVHNTEHLMAIAIVGPFLFLRYRDDIFVIWTGTLQELNVFFEWLNTFHKDIKFTMSEPSNVGIEFLETFVYIKGDQLHTKPYSKPCDNHMFLLPTSCHPTHTMENIPYSTAHRIYKICSEKECYEEAKIEYTGYLVARGYNIDLIKEAFITLLK